MIESFHGKSSDLKVHSHQAKARAKAKKIKEQSTIKREIQNKRQTWKKIFSFAHPEWAFRSIDPAHARKEEKMPIHLTSLDYTLNAFLLNSVIHWTFHDIFLCNSTQQIVFLEKKCNTNQRGIFRRVTIKPIHWLYRYFNCILVKYCHLRRYISEVFVTHFRIKPVCEQNRTAQTTDKCFAHEWRWKVAVDRSWSSALDVSKGHILRCLSYYHNRQAFHSVPMQKKICKNLKI